MAKYPNHGGYSKIPTAGCGGSIIMIILTALCPPLVTVFWAIYSAYDSSSQNTKDTLQNVIVILIIGFVLIGAPVVTILSFFIMGIEETLSNGGWFLALITIIEIIVIWHIIIKNYQKNKIIKNSSHENTLNISDSSSPTKSNSIEKYAYTPINKDTEKAELQRKTYIIFYQKRDDVSFLIGLKTFGSASKRNYYTPILLTMFNKIMDLQYNKYNERTNTRQIDVIQKFIHDNSFAYPPANLTQEFIWCDSYEKCFCNNQLIDEIKNIGNPSNTSYAWFIVYQDYDSKFKDNLRGIAYKFYNIYLESQSNNYQHLYKIEEFLNLIDSYYSFYIKAYDDFVEKFGRIDCFDTNSFTSKMSFYEHQKYIDEKIEREHNTIFKIIDFLEDKELSSNNLLQ